LDLQRISWTGGLVVIVSVLPALYFLLAPGPDPHVSVSSTLRSQTETLPPELNLPLSSDLSGLLPVSPQEQISFSLDPVRPDVRGEATHFLIRLRDSRQMKRVEMPARIGLAFDSQGTLQFSNDSTLFWLECHLLADERVTASLHYRTPMEKVVTQAEWIPTLIQTPLQTADEFACDNPFREFAEIEWLGLDLLQQKAFGNTVHRLVGCYENNYINFDVRVGDWFAYTEKGWKKCDSPDTANKKNVIDQNLPLAHIQSANSQFMEVEGWNGTSHHRFRWTIAPPRHFKVKPDEVFSQIRVRSEKQVSCMIEKQCFVLRPGDWVFKTADRWKALRKPEEKESIVKGDLVGDLFILEKIGISGANKNIVGCYISPSRAQMIPVELAQKTQKGRKANK
jgi:hypothetical protein